MVDYETCGRTKRDGSGDPCKRPAGWGTDHPGEGACKFHGGNAGAPANNQNATKHGLNADPHHYYQSLSLEEKEFIEKIATTIEDRVQEYTGEVDHMDRVLARRVAIKFHIVSKASDYIANESGLIQDWSNRKEAAPLLEEVRQYDDSIFQDLKKLGVLEDSESTQSDTLESWRDFIEGGRGS